MARHEALTQTLLKGVEIDARFEMAEWWRADAGTGVVPADGMALRAEPYRKRSAAPFGGAQCRSVARRCNQRSKSDYDRQ